MKSIIAASALFLASVLPSAHAANLPAPVSKKCITVASACVPRGTVYSIIYTMNPSGSIGSSFGTFYPTYNDCITAAIHESMHPVFTSMSTIMCYIAG